MEIRARGGRDARRLLRPGGSVPRAVARRASALALALLLVWAQAPVTLWAEALGASGSPIAAGEGAAQDGAGTGQESTQGGSSAPGQGDPDGSSDTEGVSSGSRPAATTPAVSDGAAGSTQDSSQGGSTPSGGASTGSAGEAAGATPSPAPTESEAAQAGGTAQDPQPLAVTVSVIGRGADGALETWAAPSAYEVPAGSAADAATEAMFAQQGLDADYGTGEYGFYLNTISSPADPALTLGWDESTGRYWQLFVNGKASDEGASSVGLEAGDTITWFYSAYGEALPAEQPPVATGDDAERATITASVRVVGASAQAEDGSYTQENWVPLTEVTAEEGATAWELFAAALDKAGCTYECEGYLVPASIASPAGLTLGSTSSAPYSYWSFEVNGDYANEGAGSYEVQDGDTIELVYIYGEGTPTAGGVELDPDAARPDWDAAWPGYADAAGSGSAVTTAPTATDETEALWTAELDTYVSNPLIVGGYVYTVSGNELVMLDAKTGAEVRRGKLVASAGFVSPNMAYAEGLILVPLSEGRLQALTADTLATVWVTDALPAGGAGAQQSQTAVTVHDGYAYFGTVSATSSTSYGGYLVCVNLANGAVRWCHESAGGYYWAGSLVQGDYLVAADDAGTLAVMDARTGAVLDTAELGARSRSGVVSDGAGGVIAITNDGVLYRYALTEGGTLVERGSVKFGSSATGTPAVCDGKIYVGGASETEGVTNQWGYTVYYGQLAVIDLDSMTVEHRISYAGDEPIAGAVQSAPLVSRQGGTTYVYFTANTKPGGVYCYRLGDSAAKLIYTPDQAQQNYCMASVTCDENGVLYYVNDSHTLFALKGAATDAGAGGETDQGGRPEGGGSQGGGLSDVLDTDRGGATAAGAPAASRRPLSAAVLATPGSRPIAASARGADAAEPGDGTPEAAAGHERSTASVASAAPMNTWALAGAGAGTVGLVAIGGYLFFGKRWGGAR